MLECSLNITSEVTATQYTPLEFCAEKYSHKTQATALGACFKCYKHEILCREHEMKKYYLYILLTLFVSACTSHGREGHVKNEQTGDQTKNDIIQPDKIWQCRDYVYDDHMALELIKTNITVGDVMMQVLDEAYKESDTSIEELKSDSDARDALNKLKEFYLGSIWLSGEEPEGAIYHRQGLNHRWEWGDGYVFILEPSGRGYYYDFKSAEEGESVRPSDSFKCKRK